MMRRSSFVCGLCVLAGCAAAPPPSDPQPQLVQMRFGWQPGLESRVEVIRERAVNEAPVATVSFSYTLTVTEAGDNLLVSSSDYDLGDPQAVTDATAAQLDGLAAVAGSLQPAMLVTTEGEFVGVTDLEDHGSRLRRVVAERYPSEASPQLQAVLAMLTSPAYLRAAAEAEWRFVAGAVAGTQFVPGRVYRFAARQPAPWLPGAPEVLIETESMLREAPDCVREGRPRTCVEFEMRWRADPDDVERIIAELDRQTAIGNDIPTYEHLAMENVLVLVTEPDGLYPHRYEVNKNLQARHRDRAGQVREDQRRERTRVTYRY